MKKCLFNTCLWFLVLTLAVASVAIAAFATDGIDEQYPVSPIEGYLPVPSKVYDHLASEKDVMNALYPVSPIEGYLPAPSEVYDHLISEEDVIPLGDVNNDGRVNSSDARLALRFVAKLDPVDSLTFKVIDVNEDSLITASDARLILRIASKLA
ncbi:MAG: dockerin type I repeat-containing protein [Clostridia bacterium]|nr:dockerin type I repeat-containing protein [Clostridia bacterium]